MFYIIFIGFSCILILCRYFLVLYAGQAPRGSKRPEAKMDVEEDTATFVDERLARKKRKGKHVSVRGRQWIVEKKETLRKKGKHVRPDTKYTGRKRSTRF
jgi:18S rRNA (guanine1575-N7)-methyltransferase